MYILLQENIENLSLQLSQQEREFEEKEQQLRQKHREEVNQLRQEVVTLSIKVPLSLISYLFKHYEFMYVS